MQKLFVWCVVRGNVWLQKERVVDPYCTFADIASVVLLSFVLSEYPESDIRKAPAVAVFLAYIIESRKGRKL
jgi:hypothetical protein